MDASGMPVIIQENLCIQLFVDWRTACIGDDGVVNRRSVTDAHALRSLLLRSDRERVLCCRLQFVGRNTHHLDSSRIRATGRFNLLVELVSQPVDPATVPADEVVAQTVGCEPAPIPIETHAEIAWIGAIQALVLQ